MEKATELLFLLLLFFPVKIFGIRDAGFEERLVCRNTVQGRYLLSDDHGYVCTALSVNPWSRCCPKAGERFSCQGCNLVSQCCTSYEYCVSCCLNPLKTKKDLALKVKIAKPITAGTYASLFDFCAGRCRHNSASVVHENAYASDFHHCFHLQSNSSGGLETNSEASLSGVDVIVGRQGESCNSVCKSRGQSCVPNRLSVLNNCEHLQKYMRCKASCSPSIGQDQPAEVVDDAPKHMVLSSFTFLMVFLDVENGISGYCICKKCNDLLNNVHSESQINSSKSGSMLVYAIGGHTLVRWLPSAYPKTLPMCMSYGIVAYNLYHRMVSRTDAYFGRNPCSCSELHGHGECKSI